jgi:hypothetical protein
MEINIMGLRTYVFDPSEEDRTYYEVSVRMLDADPSVPIQIQPPLYNNPPPLPMRQAQVPWYQISQPNMISGPFPSAAPQQQSVNPLLYKGPAQVVSIPAAYQMQSQVTEPVYEQRLRQRETIERTVEKYIDQKLKDFEESQDAMRQMNAELNKIALIEYQMTLLFTNGTLTDTRTAYSAEKAYAEAYIEERARAVVTILDPNYMWKSYKGQVFVGKVSQMRLELEKNPNGQAQQNLSLTTQQLMSMMSQTRNN